MKNRKDIFNGYILKEYRGVALFTLIFVSLLFLVFAIIFVGILIFNDSVDFPSRILLAVLSVICAVLWIVFPIAGILSVRSYPKHKRLANFFFMNYVFVKIPEIRIGGLSDARILAELGAQTFWETFAHCNTESDMRYYLDNIFTTERLTQELETQNSTFYIAEIDGRPAAYMKLNTANAQTEKNREGWVEIQRLYVFASYARMHIGSALMIKALEYAASINADGVWLGVWEFNEKAKAFYTKFGFSFNGSHEFILGQDRQRDLIMEKTDLSDYRN